MLRLQFLESEQNKPSMVCLSFFVAVVLMVGLSNRSCASCGDYLHHAESYDTSRTVDPSVPISKCVNGECRSAPIPVQQSPTRVVIVRQLVCDFPCHFYLMFGLADARLFLTIELQPEQPFLDLADPPPRSLSV